MKIPRFLFRLTVAFITVVTLHTSTVNIANSQTKKAFLWSLESANNTIYILGSMHALKPSDYPLPQTVNQVFAEAEHLVFEIDLNKSDDPRTAQIVEQKARPDAPNESLKNALDQNTYKLAEQQVQQLGLPIQVFDDFEPWFLYLTLGGVDMAKSGYSSAYGIDRYLFEAGMNSDKEISVLETIEQQLDIFDKMPVSTQAKLLRQTIAEAQTSESELDVLADAWKSGNVNKLNNLLLESFRAYPELQKILLVDRNKNWVQQIKPLINQSDDYLIVVGAAHLVGQDSLIELMQKEGYQLKQL